MSRPVLPLTDDKPRYIADMFGRIAWRYDLMNTLMTGGQDQRWRRLVARATVGDRSASTGLRILDVGTGTARLVQAIQDQAPAALAVGVDFTTGMLRAAPRALRLAAADALRLPFAGASFDAVVSAFVMRNVGDLDLALAEQVRVLRPGGRLIILETTPGPPGLLRTPYRFAFRTVVPLLGGLIAGDPSAYTYLPESTLAFLEPDRLVARLESHGLTQTSITRLALGSVALSIARKPSVMLPTSTGDTL